MMATGCPSNYDFKYTNGSCLSTCPDPYQIETVSGSAFCNRPCADKFFDSAKNTCVDSCHRNFVREEDGIRYCDASTLCPLRDSFENPSPSCTSACPHPLRAIDLGNGTYDCQSPCLDHPYYDIIFESCFDSCQDEDVREEDNILFCDERPSSPTRCPKAFDFKYANGSCGPTCPEPYYRQMTDDGSYYCLPACEQGQYFDYLQWICIDSCEPQYIRVEDNNIYCDRFTPCSSVYEYKYANGSCLDSCPSPGITLSFENSGYFCDVPCPKGQFHDEQYRCVNSCDGLIKSRDRILYCVGGSNPDSLGNN